MEFKKYFNIFLLEEKFKNVADLLMNPQNNDKSWYDLMKEFTQSGGQFLGEGAFAKVLYHPDWNYVIKIFPHDDCYLRFVRYAMRNPSPHYPKFYDKPRRIYPNFARNYDNERIYFVRTELLEPIDILEFRDIETMHAYLGNKNKTIEGIREDQREYILNLIKKNPHLLPFVRAYDKMITDPEFGKECALDFKRGNIMKAKDGTYVITDPIWHGTTPDQIARDNINALMDIDYSYEDNEPPPPLIKGGQRYKAPPKPKLPSINVMKGENDDIPF